MKNLYSCLTLLLFLTSCTNDPAPTAADKNQNIAANPMMRLANELPVNPKNNFDLAGEVYFEITESYLASYAPSANATAVLTAVNSIAAANNRFQALKGSNYIDTTPGMIQNAVNNPVTSVAETINKLEISSSAKLSFLLFLQNLKTRCLADEAYDSLYNFIVSYENTVAESTAIDSRDKQVLLTSTSIARFETYRKKRRPKKNTDQDWDWLIAGIAADTEGAAQYSTGNAITMAASVAIVFE